MIFIADSLLFFVISYMPLQPFFVLLLFILQNHGDNFDLFVVNFMFCVVFINNFYSFM